MTVGLRPRYSPVVQLVERWTVNPYVAGSSPARGANFLLPPIFDLCLDLDYELHGIVHVSV